MTDNGDQRVGVGIHIDFRTGHASMKRGCITSLEKFFDEVPKEHYDTKISGFKWPSADNLNGMLWSPYLCHIIMRHKGIRYSMKGIAYKDREAFFKRHYHNITRRGIQE